MKFSRSVLVSLACLSSPVTIAANAQTEVFARDGDAAGDRFGSALCVVGDVDADGFGDVAIGAPESDAGSLNGGRVTVISGRTRQVIRTWNGAVAQARFGRTLAACGDLDADGHADVVIGAPGLISGPNGAVQVLSGANGSVLRSWTGAPGFGSALAADGDASGDGVADVLVGSPIAGELWVFDGATGALLRQHTFTGSSFGSSAAYIGDVTGDGRAEYAAGDPNTWGDVRAFHASTGALLWMQTGSFGDQLGATLAGVADLNSDGRPDLLAGAQDEGSFGSDGRGYVMVIDGFSGAILQVVDGANPDDHLGLALAAADDLDADGRGDFLASQSSTFTNGAVQVRRGSDRAVIASMPPAQLGIGWGSTLAFGDVSGDGLADVVIGAPLADAGGVDAGAVFVFTVVRAPTTYCSSETNSIGCSPAIGSSGTPSASLATAFDVNAAGVLNNKSGLLFYGFKPRQTPFQGGHMCVVAPTQRTPAQSSGGAAPPTSDCSGAFSFDFNARIQGGGDPQLVAGGQVFAQYWSRDPADASTTNLSDALAFFIEP